MHAGVTPFKVRDGMMAEGVQIYLGQVIPAMGGQHGFQGVLVLTDTASDEGYAISLWETEDDARAFEDSGVYKEQMAGFGNIFAEPPERGVYEVSVQM